ncbi:hypothetical protein NF867_16645 [Solitalea sp. MAHUQ-68]|uniref:Outer membrane protein beta-barrel domain-containing protein n=1 Tax=Solitalea agri TaxID=2953739 RepID=A0A9X2FCS2_9SPHI|nr:hypothetical protein [Solitalea agri]MCO4294493.1 hypothetical protein [Solitalea agri]
MKTHFITQSSTAKTSMFILLVCIFQLVSFSVKAQNTTEGKWHFLIEPYIMFPNMHGTVGLGELPDASIDENPGDIFSHLKIGAMLYAEASNDKWSISSDLLYMKLGEDVTPRQLINSGEVTIQQLAWELAVLHRFLPWLDAGVSAFVNNIKADADLDLSQGGATSRNLNQTWVDPTIVARVKIPLSTKWQLQARGNIGGFGIGSDFMWQMQTYFSYQMSKTIVLSAGYRIISSDYKNGEGSDRFLYNVDTFGPVLRFGLNF